MVTARGKRFRAFWFLCVVLAALAFIDCGWKGYRIWATPIRYEVVEGRNPGPNEAGTANSHYEYRSFREVSSYGIAPLLLPMLLSAIALLSGWIIRPIILFIVAGIFLLFIFVTGFSIGGTYMLSGLGLILAAIAALAARRFQSERNDPVTNKT